LIIYSTQYQTLTAQREEPFQVSLPTSQVIELYCGTRKVFITQTSG